MSPEQFFMDGKDEREIFGEVNFCSRVISENSFYGGTEKKKQGWTFVLVSPEHISINEQEEIQGHNFVLLFSCRENSFSSALLCLQIPRLPPGG